MLLKDTCSQATQNEEQSTAHPLSQSSQRVRDLALSYGKYIDAGLNTKLNTKCWFSEPTSMEFSLFHHTKATQEGRQRFVLYLQDKETTNVSRRKKHFQSVNHARQT